MSDEGNGETSKSKKPRGPGPARVSVEQVIGAYNALHPEGECQSIAFEAAAPGSWRVTINGATVSESRPTASEAAKDFLATAVAELYARSERAKAEASEQKRQLRAITHRTRAFADKHRGTLPGL